MPSQNSPLTLHVKELSRNYDQKIVVNNVSFELRKGEVLGFLGPNGAGKSTTMRMLTGNLAPSDGSIQICGIDLLENPKAAKAKIGYLPEIPPLYKELTVDEYLRFVGRLHQMTKSALPTAIERAKQRCGLVDVGNRLIGNLSKGYQQRVGIAQAIVHNPDVVILDEPTVGLDPIQVREIRTLIRELGGEHSVIISTHILPEVESVCDRVQIMHQGQLVFSDSIEALKRHMKGNSLLIGLRNPPEMTTLQKITGVSSINALPDGQFIIHYEADSNPSDLLIQAASSGGWELYLLNPAHASLEDIFVQLTTVDVTPQSRDTAP
ncbi:ABC transporter ATP-binding protein [Sulfurirhabdus autotrophica]|uniref:ABC-2 type transport system ATP-binding protein n=1 Tax=Sulfurirhabdus autotrophica TaxID=1706046 RepID=A0A4R3XY44_9PROT|nr:ATP-binding cassette domain-containing protein [Sulfurirhabdus autotrophica]TCV84725.1 ABC-2 type transport system ATP-binding protein [Sulfurirhabdus autotrophica]